MDMKKDSVLANISTPIVNAIYKSPFDGLDRHTGKIEECIAALRKCVCAFIDGDHVKAREYAEEVSRIEHEADLIKANIRSHLPKFIFMSVTKSDFLHLLHNSDSILDYAEDVAVLIAMKETEVPPGVRNHLIKVMDKVLRTVKAYQRVMSHMGILLEVSFGGKERQKVKRYIKQIHKYEHDSDIAERDVSRMLFNIPPEELDPMSVHHLLKIVDRMGEIANKAENAGGKVRAMLA
jgi:predicted phosphate transport protein (TIGR00153 family)